MKNIGKALAFGFAIEIVAMGISVVLGFIPVPDIYYSQLSIPGWLNWIRVPLALIQIVGVSVQSLYHGLWHRVHSGGDFCPDPLHLFIIIFVANAFFWSAIGFVYNQWRAGRNKHDHLLVKP
jgi:hypothetical protein